MKEFKNYLLILKIYTLVLSIFSVFRIILFLTELNRINLNEDNIWTIFYAFIMGIRFDIVISGYILFLPALLILLQDIFNKSFKAINKFIFYWTFLLFTISFSISAADIPYFNQFFSRFSIGAFEWMENYQFVFSMLTQEPKYFLITIPLIILVIIFFKILKRIIPTKKNENHSHLITRIIFSILILGLIFIGMRGRIQKKSPIRIGTAYFSTNPFLNQLGLNPVYTLMRSYLDSKKENNKAIQLIDTQLAIGNVQKALNINHQDFDSPIARRVLSDSTQNKYNVVLIIMESMSAGKMGRHGNTNNLTPFLDSLSYNSLYFENIYTAGKHTFNGIFSTLFSFPALYRQHPLKKISKYNGISSVLKNHGYTTTYFTTHDSQFDNVEGFLRANDFENIISQSSYPIEAVKTTLGVPDDYMFDFSLPIIDKLHSEDKPFFVTFMTASDHGPYYIPDYFQAKNSDVKQQIVEYADWSLKKFIDKSREKEWFPNTIFIFIADHGAPINAHYDISLDYHHSPLIFYAPEILKKNQSVNKIGGQIDIFPTTMGILNLPYINNTLGINLLKSSRPYIFINDDDKVGILDNEFLLIFKKENKSKLYKYKDFDKTDYIDSYPNKAIEMEEYAKSNMQTFQYMLLNNKQYIENYN